MHVRKSFAIAFTLLLFASLAYPWTRNDGMEVSEDYRLLDWTAGSDGWYIDENKS